MENYDFLLNRKPILWLNRKKEKYNERFMTISEEDMIDAEKRLKNFAPLIEKLFPETKETNGIIESKLTEITNMKNRLNKNDNLKGRLFLKEDCNLPIAGSVKARGGIYEVLKYAEKLALENNLLKEEDNYIKLADENIRRFFSQYKIQVGSTGNLGLSIGITGSKLGFTTIVHMSEDAKQWKKDLLRKNGVLVKEYYGDYGKAVEEGRKESENDKKSYFIDDENSLDLFLGYTVAAKRLEKQIDENKIIVDEKNPLFVYIPCGVGGAPGGIGYGLKKIYKDNIHIFFVEPIECPCLLLAIESKKYENIAVTDIGFSGKTEADGLAVGRASGLVSKLMENLLSGVFTVRDEDLYIYMKKLWQEENIFLEPSGCASFEGFVKLFYDEKGKEYLEENNLKSYMENSTHILWGTGGKLVPDNLKIKLLE